MKKKTAFRLAAILVMIMALACTAPQKTTVQIPAYQPDDKELFATILYHDSVFFYAYNHCTTLLDQYAAYYADDIEFYHDKGGLSVSKKEIVSATQKNICGKVTRELVKGSVEVYPIKNFGAIEIGWHIFHNKEEPAAVAQPGRFVIVWRHLDDRWQMTRVISLH